MTASTVIVANLGFDAYIRKLDGTNDTLKYSAQIDELTYTHNIIDKHVIYLRLI